MTKRKPVSTMTVLNSLFALLFVGLAAIVVANANGYIFNRHTLRFESTGIITFNVNQPSVTVAVNGKKKTYKKPVINLSYLFPGRYTVEISKTDYLSWTRSFTVYPREVINNPSIFLFLTNGRTQTATPEQTAFLQQYGQNINKDTLDLDVRGDELWTKPIVRTYPLTVVSEQFNLIGRYVQPIHSAQWLPGKGQVLYQVGDEIRVVDRDGGNDNMLVRLTSAEATDFTVTKNSTILVYRDGVQYFQRQLFDD